MKRSTFIKSLPALIGLISLPFFFKNDMRRVEYYDNGWKKIKFKNVKKNMYVQMFESTGETVVMGQKEGKDIYGALVTKSSYAGKGGVPTFNTEIL